MHKFLAGVFAIGIMICNINWTIQMRGVKKLQNWMILAKIKTPWIKSLKMAKKGNHSHYVDVIAINTIIIIPYSSFFLELLNELVAREILVWIADCVKRVDCVIMNISIV